MNLRDLNFACLISIVTPLTAGCTSTKDLSDGDTEASTQDGTSAGATTEDDGNSMSSSSTQGGSASSTSGSSTSGSTSTSTSGGTAEATEGGSTGEAVDCDPFPSEDAPCSVPGETCSTDCSDQCQFCNIMSCEDGLWQRTEVFPANCLECPALCVPVVAAGCAGGPPDMEACVLGCEQTIDSECNSEFSAMRACVGSEPTFTCNEALQPEVAGCEDAFDMLYACMNG